ncbi:MAG: hypothetical protein R3E83_01735 [Burkholderiaceae bacterium]
MKHLVVVLAALALSTPVVVLACPGKGEQASSTGSTLLQQNEARDQS